MSARKDDKGKTDLSLVPYIAIVRLAEAMAVGERKYGRYNYCKGLKSSQMLGAMLRHAFAWFDGQERDPVDGQHHLGSAMANCLMILRQQELGTLNDDRFSPPDEPEGDEGAEGPNFVCEPADDGVFLVELDNGPEEFWRKTVDGLPIFGISGYAFPRGTLVWVRRDTAGCIYFVERFEGIPA